MTEFELISLLRVSATTISDDFEFFITATFAVILVSYFAGDRLNKLPRIIITILYMGSVALFLFRYQNIVEQLGFITASLRDLGSDFPATSNFPFAFWIRRLIVVFGAAAAVYSIFWPVLKLRKDTESENSANGT